MHTTPATTKVRAGLYRLELVIESTGAVATFSIEHQPVGDDERMRWVVSAEDSEERTVVSIGDSDEHTTKRDAVASAVRFAQSLVPHELYGWVVDPTR